jgi:hypothetical protein
MSGAIAFAFFAPRYEHGRFYNAREVFDKLINWKWPLMLLQITDEEILEQSGLDALMFLRFNRLCFKLFASYTLFGCIALGPVYRFIGEEGSSSAIMSFSMNNILPNHLKLGNNVLWASTATGYLYTMYGLYIFHQECKDYIKLRHTFLKRRLPNQFSVFVEEIPSQMQSTELLRAFFKLLYPESFHGASLVIVAPDLAQAKEKYSTVKKQIRRTIILEKAHGAAVYKTGWCTWMVAWIPGCAPKERLLPHLRKIARELKKEVQQLAGELEGQMRDETRASRSRLASSKLARSQLLEVDHGGHKREQKSSSKGLKEPLLSGSQLHEDEAHGEYDFNAVAAVPDSEGSRREHPSLLLSKGSQLLMNPRQWSTLFQSDNQAFRLGKMAAIITGKHFSSTGFVTFKSMTAAVIAQNMRHIHNGMRVKPAPPVDSVIWTNVGLPDYAKFLRGWAVFGISVALTMAWSVPVALMSGLTNAENIQDWTGLDIEACGWCKLLLKMLSPLLLAFLFSLLPPLFEWLALQQGASAKEELHSSVFKKYFQFIVIQSLAIYLVGGALMDSVTAMLNDPKQVPNILGKAIPAKANFFMQFILLRALPLNILQLFRKTAALQLYTLRAWNKTVASTQRLARAATAGGNLARKMTARAAARAADAGVGTVTGAYSGARKMTSGAAGAVTGGARKMTAGAAGGVGDAISGARKMTAGATGAVTGGVGGAISGARKMTAGAGGAILSTAGAAGAVGRKLTARVTGGDGSAANDADGGGDDSAANDADGGGDDEDQTSDMPLLNVDYEETSMQAPTADGEAGKKEREESSGKRMSYVEAYKSALPQPVDVSNQGRPERRSMTLDVSAEQAAALVAQVEANASELETTDAQATTSASPEPSPQNVEGSQYQPKGDGPVESKAEEVTEGAELQKERSSSGAKLADAKAEAVAVPQAVPQAVPVSMGLDQQGRMEKKQTRVGFQVQDEPSQGLEVGKAGEKAGAPRKSTRVGFAVPQDKSAPAEPRKKTRVGFAVPQDGAEQESTPSELPSNEELTFTFTEPGSLGIDVDEDTFEEVVGVTGAAAAVGMRAGDTIIGMDGERFVIDRRSMLTNQLTAKLSSLQRPCTIEVRRTIPPPEPELSFTFTEPGSLGIDVDEDMFEEVVGVTGAAAAVGMRAGDTIIGMDGERFVIDRRSMLTNQLTAKLSSLQRPCTIEVRRPVARIVSAPTRNTSPRMILPGRRKNTRVGFASEDNEGAQRPPMEPKRKNTRVGFAPSAEAGPTREMKGTRGVDKECTLDIVQGPLGINISKSTDKGYSTQFNFFTGDSKADQLTAGELQPGMLLVKINGSNQIGVGYEDVVRIIEGERPIELLFRNNMGQQRKASKKYPKDDGGMEMYATSGAGLIKKKWGASSGKKGGEEEGMEMQEMTRNDDELEEEWRVSIDSEMSEYDDEDTGSGEDAEEEEEIFSPSKFENPDNPLPIQMADSMLIFYIGVVYVVVCPFVSICPTLYFFTTELLWRHQLYFVFKRDPNEEEGGVAWLEMYQRVLFGFWLAMLVLIGVTSLKQGVVTVIVLIPLLVFIPLLGNESLHYCRVASASLPLYDAHNADSMLGCPPVESVLQDVPPYQQPFLRGGHKGETKEEASLRESAQEVERVRSASNV